MSDVLRRRAVLFDVDGTLVDSNFLHVTAWSRAFAQLGAPVDSWRIHRCIGMDGSLLLQTCAPGSSDGFRSAAGDLHSRYYRSSAAELRCLRGARELVRAVAGTGRTVVLASSAPPAEFALLRRVLNVDDAVAATTSAEDVETAKPQPDIVTVALRRAGVSATDAVFVGDATWDGQACRQAGVPFVGVLTGGTSQAQLIDAGATTVFTDAADILEHFDARPLRPAPAMPRR